MSFGGMLFVWCGLHIHEKCYFTQAKCMFFIRGYEWLCVKRRFLCGCQTLLTVVEVGVVEVVVVR